MNLQFTRAAEPLHICSKSFRNTTEDAARRNIIKYNSAVRCTFCEHTYLRYYKYLAAQPHKKSILLHYI